MSRAREVHVVSARTVAFETALVHFFCRGGLETEDLLGIARVVDMAGSWTVASFASLFGRAATLVEQGFPVRRFIKIGENIFVTGLANLSAGVFFRLLACDCLLLPVSHA